MTDRADLTAERADAPMHGRELVDDWIERLRQQLIQLEHDHRDLDAELDLWQAGSRPRELRDAIARRSNHLAYTAIVSQEAWVAHLAERWGNRPTPGDVLGLHALVVLTAAHRERARHHGDQHEDLKLLVDYRDQLHHERTRVCNRLHADLAIAYPGYQRGIGKALTSRRSLNKVDELLAADHSVRADLDRQRLARLREIDAELKQVVIQLEVLIEASGSTLVDIVASVPWSLRVCSARSATLGGSRLLRRLPPATAPHRSTCRRAATNTTASTAAATGGSIGRSTRSLSPRHATNLEPPTTSPANALPATPVEEPYAASSAASPTSSTEPCSKTPPDLTHRS